MSINPFLQFLPKSQAAIIFLNKNVDPSILGGIIVQIGDKVYDASALRKLKKMEVVMNGIDVHDYALEKPEAMT